MFQMINILLYRKERSNGSRTGLLPKDGPPAELLHPGNPLVAVMCGDRKKKIKMEIRFLRTKQRSNILPRLIATS